MFADDEDRLTYLDMLRRGTLFYGWDCLAFCLMGNHMHLLVRTPRPTRSAGMQWIHGSYARAFNDRHGRTGHLFESRYGWALVETDAYLWMVTAYIARNPVDAGLVQTADEYSWSSHYATAMGNGPSWLASDRLLKFFGAAGGDPRERYRQFVDGR